MQLSVKEMGVEIGMFDHSATRPTITASLSHAGNLPSEPRSSGGDFFRAAWRGMKRP